MFALSITAHQQAYRYLYPTVIKWYKITIEPLKVSECYTLLIAMIIGVNREDSLIIRRPLSLFFQSKACQPWRRLNFTMF